MFDQFYKARRTENAHYNFTNLFMWRKIYNIQWTTVGNFLCLKASYEGETFFLPPFGNEQGFSQVIDKIMEYCHQESIPFLLSGVESYMLEWLEKIKPGHFKITADRDNFDYVYLASDLIALKGRKFHTKKNHANSFRKNNPNYTYVPMDCGLALQCIDFTKEWCKKRNCQKGDSIDCEKNAIIEALTNFDELGFVGGVIFINNKIEAYTFGEMINDDTVVVHVEKGNSDFRGIYAVINQDYCANTWQHIKYINREEDMGIEGLRKAKESYNPIKMIEKYIVTINE